MAGAAVPQVLVAHRGFGGSAQVKYNVPENSIKAWDLAIVQAERDFIVDIDAQWTSDGVMVAMHDRSLKRTTNGSGNIDQRTWSYVKGLWLELPVDRDGNSNDDNTTSRVPSISTALDFLKPRTVNGVPVKVTIEMKGDKWTQSRVNALKAKLAPRGMFTNRVNVHSFNNTYAGYAKKAGLPQHRLCGAVRRAATQLYPSQEDFDLGVHPAQPADPIQDQRIQRGRHQGVGLDGGHPVRVRGDVRTRGAVRLDHR